MNWISSLGFPRWYEASAILPNELKFAFPSATIRRFEWEGWNDQATRYAAALRLARLVEDLGSKFSHVVVIAHSHGGNVALQAIQKYPGKNTSLVTLGTPFLEIQKESNIQRLGLLFVLLYTFILVALAGIFIRSIFISAGRLPVVSSGLAFLLAAWLFYVLLVKIKLATRLAAMTKTTASNIRLSFDCLRITRPLRVLPLRYESDQILRLSQYVLRKREMLNSSLGNSENRMDRLYHHFIAFCFVFAFIPILLAANFYFLHSILVLYLLVILVTIVLAWIAVVFLLSILPFFRIMLSIAARYKAGGYSIGSFIVAENVLISFRTKTLPVGFHEYVGAPPPPLTPPVRAWWHHSYICSDPNAAKTIIRWLRAGYAFG